jgi:hypothetical protein
MALRPLCLLLGVVDDDVNRGRGGEAGSWTRDVAGTLNVPSSTTTREGIGDAIGDAIVRNAF